jgi:Tfp pilus assembly protein FimT
MIELMAVVAILAIMATIVTVNWRAILPKTELTSSVRILATTISGTRSEAIARNAVFRIEYDLERHRYRQNTPFRNDGSRRLAFTEEERLVLNWIDLPETVRFHRIVCDGVEYAAGIVSVRFDPLGAVSDHTITLVQQPYENYFTLEVSALTGLLEYHEGFFVREPAKESDFQ